MVDSVSDLVFIVQNPVSEEKSQVHACRLCRYADKSLHLTVPMKEVIASGSGLYDVAKVVDHRRSDDPHVAFELLTSWSGFGTEADSWEPFDSIASSASSLVSAYLLSVLDDSDRSEMNLRLSSL